MSNTSSYKRVLKVIGSELSHTYKDLDAAIAEKLPQDVSCKKGCTACCSQLVSASWAEGAAIMVNHSLVVRLVRDKLIEQAEAIEKLAGELGLSECRVCTDNFDEVMEKLRAMADRYWALKLPCAFLRDGLCSIYDNRPISCRGYYVKSAPELCGSAEGTQVHVVSIKATELSRAQALTMGPPGTNAISYLPVIVAALFDAY